MNTAGNSGKSLAVALSSSVSLSKTLRQIANIEETFSSL